MTQTDFAGFYYDGKTASRARVILRLGPDGIEIHDPLGNPMFLWGYGGLRLSSLPDPGLPALLTHGDHAGERLLSSDGTIITNLAALAPALFHRTAFGRDNWRLMGWCMGVALILAGAVWIINLAAEPIAKRLPLAWEKPLGVNIINEMAEGSRRCHTTAGQAALKEMMARLGQDGKIPRGIDVVVLDDPKVNAFAAPGGQIAILRGLIDKAGSSDEVAGVLAHEIGHVIHRHPTQLLIKLIGGSIFLQMFSGGGDLATVFLSLSYSREAEAEADGEAISLLGSANISTAGLADFFARMMREQEQHDLVGSLLSDHPGHTERLARLRAAQNGKTSRPPLTAVGWQALRTICQHKKLAP